MDRQSHYKWELTSDELDTIWHALIDRRDKLCESADKTTDPELKQLRKNLAAKCYDLQGQINRMRTRYY